MCRLYVQVVYAFKHSHHINEVQNRNRWTTLHNFAD